MCNLTLLYWQWQILSEVIVREFEHCSISEMWSPPGVCAVCCWWSCFDKQWCIGKWPFLVVLLLLNSSCCLYENIPVVHVFVPLPAIFKRYTFIIFSLLLCHTLSWCTVVLRVRPLSVGIWIITLQLLSLSKEFLDWGKTHRRPNPVAAIFLHVVFLHEYLLSREGNNHWNFKQLLHCWIQTASEITSKYFIL